MRVMPASATKSLSGFGSGPRWACLGAQARRAQRGTTLIEGLVAFLALALGMSGLARVQSQLRLSSDLARQTSEAVRIAQEEVEKMRAFSVIAPRAGANAYASLTSGSSGVDAGPQSGRNTGYVLTREVSAADAPASKSANLRVAWDDRTGARQQVTLNTIIAGHDPAYSGALKLMPQAKAVRNVQARSASIPIDAKDLGNGSSAYKPLAGTNEVLLLDNLTGDVAARCTSVDLNPLAAGLSAAALGPCVAMQGYLLSGTVRFTAATPPEPGAANDVPLGLSIAVAIQGGGPAPDCRSEARKTVRRSVAGVTRSEAVPIDATAGVLGVGEWAETGERYVAYHCVVTPVVAGGTWTGRSAIVAAGWRLGFGAGERRVCRFSADLDASGAIDNNLEHPDTYVGVGTSLSNQNFLVVNGTQACPEQSAPVATSRVFADLTTAPHQP
jgi:Tfp pilus assembly protein PilV